MPNPDIKIIACSNVYVRQMHFHGKGDVEVGHAHTFDHATLLSNGSVLYEILDDSDGNVLEQKEFTAPNMIYVVKDKFHRLTALEDNTICACIHAMRSVEDIIPPDSFIEPMEQDKPGRISGHVEQQLGMPWVNLTHAAK